MAKPNLKVPELTEQDIRRFHSKYICGLNPDDCYIWIGGFYKNHYGGFSAADGRKSGHRSFLAHRLSYFIHNEYYPGDLVVMHKCDNPRCVNPRHLSLGDQNANIQDALSKGRILRGEASHQSRLTLAQVQEIKDQVKKGAIRWRVYLSYTQKFPEVSARTIKSIVYSENWRWVE